MLRQWLRLTLIHPGKTPSSDHALRRAAPFLPGLTAQPLREAAAGNLEAADAVAAAALLP
jgi:hypothetical protein